MPTLIRSLPAWQTLTIRIEWTTTAASRVAPSARRPMVAALCEALFAALAPQHLAGRSSIELPKQCGGQVEELTTPLSSTQSARLTTLLEQTGRLHALLSAAPHALALFERHELFLDLSVRRFSRSVALSLALHAWDLD